MESNYSPNTQKTSEVLIASPGTIILFISTLYLLRLVLISTLPLAPDEAYYWYWSTHPDWSYFDHPPMVAYLMAIATSLGGNREVFVRLGGYLSTIVTLFCIYGSYRVLFKHRSEKQGLDVLFLLNITLLFSAGCIVQTPDTPMLLFWSLALLAGAYIVSYNAKWAWYFLGVSLGLGLLSKYTMILFAPCFYGFLFLSRDQRIWLKHKEPYLALLIAVLIFSPVIYWNFSHHWTSFSYQLKQGFSSHPKGILEKMGEYLGGQAGVVTPLLFLSFLFYGIRALSVATRSDRPACLYLAALSWPIFLFFALSSVKGKVSEANWPAPTYIAGFILMWHAYANYYHFRKIHRRFMKVGIVLAIIANLLISVHLVHPFLPIPVPLDNTRQFCGWPLLGYQIEKTVESHPSTKPYFMLSDKGTTIAEAVFYSHAKYAGFDYTFPARYSFLGNIKSQRGYNAVIMLHQPREQAIKLMKPYFRDVLFVGQHIPVYRGEEIQDLSLSIFLGFNFLFESPFLKPTNGLVQ